ncbi:hypothetical protein [Isoptericola aurantiacus]|uniref:hypothetical protein n=1 Tax=Isoptericola aurantiacus TaxID=3377839 RepID=UPI00383B4BBF
MSRTLADLGIDVDLRTAPWHYPGPAAPTSGLLHDGTFRPLRHDGATWTDEDAVGLDELLHASRADGVAERQAVVAIGSNASPAVVHRKFARLGVSTTVPMVHGVLRGIDVAYIPRVNPAGYVAAVPRTRRDARSAVVVSLLTPQQAAALDETEQNYARRVGGDDLDLPGHAGTWTMYVSQLGAIADDAGTIVPHGTQESLWALLRSDVPLAALAGGGDHRDVARRLAADEHLREGVRARLLERGMTRRTGLEHLPPA